MKRKTKDVEPQFVVCIRNKDCGDLEVRKIYQVLPDKAAAEDGYIRVIDESGEDYLYPASYFFSRVAARGGKRTALGGIIPQRRRQTCHRIGPS